MATIDYFKKVISVIDSQFKELTDQITVVEETAFFMDEPDVNKIYAVVKFNSASSNFAQVSLPITIHLWSLSVDKHGIEKTKQVFMLYCLNNNIKFSDGISQFYSTPQVVMNFTPQGAGFRSLFFTSGQFIFGVNSNRITSIKMGDQEIPFLSAQFNIGITPNTQPLPNSKGLTKTINQFGTISLGVSTYMTTTNPVIAQIMQDVRLNNNFINKTYQISVAFSDAPTTYITYQMKLTTFNVNQALGSIPSVALAFTL